MLKPLARSVFAVAAAAVVATVMFVHVSSSTAEEGRVIPPPADDMSAEAGATAVAVLAGGCFWGVQGVYQHTEGVLNAVSGYAGGDEKAANYDAVSDGVTKHAEAVQITYDPRKISYGKLLQIYFSVAHDPTELNRQGPDVGPQYRSTIFPQNAEQDRVARAYIAQLDAARAYPRKIATTLESGKPFYPAEDYHQDYMTRNPGSLYIVFNDLPKVEALKRMFASLYREKPVLVADARAKG
jgi:peptide-methionine (S)-S-oxide reductase